jgi:ComF family protein
LISTLLHYLYPSRCPVCQNSGDDLTTDPFCRNCWSDIKRYTGPACKICGVPLASEYAAVCANCLKEAPPFSRAESFGLYENALATAINLFKFHGIRRLHGPLGRLLLGFDISASDAVVPVPLGLRGLRERGFNQSLLLAKVLSRHAKVPLAMDGLLKIRETRPQVGLSARERARNLKGAFSVKGNFRKMKLLLVDDVMTTGATAKECARQLMNAGAEEVAVLTLARASTL